MKRALIDTGAIYAFVTRNDAHHQAARSFVKQWMARSGAFVLSDLVFVETMTLLKSRAGSSVAVRVGQELRANASYQWMALGPEGERDTWATFARYEDKEWSYTDCSILVMAKRLKVREVFSFDDHFDQMPGVVRVPDLE